MFRTLAKRAALLFRLGLGLSPNALQIHQPCPPRVLTEWYVWVVWYLTQHWHELAPLKAQAPLKGLSSLLMCLVPGGAGWAYSTKLQTRSRLGSCRHHAGSSAPAVPRVPNGSVMEEQLLDLSGVHQQRLLQGHTGSVYCPVILAVPASAWAGHLQVSSRSDSESIPLAGLPKPDCLGSE